MLQDQHHSLRDARGETQQEEEEEQEQKREEEGEGERGIDLMPKFRSKSLVGALERYPRPNLFLEPTPAKLERKARGVCFGTSTTFESTTTPA